MAIENQALSDTGWDCTLGKIIKPSKHDEATQEAIEEALKMLAHCPSCKKMFGKTDPTALLTRLREMKAIMVTDDWPEWQGRGKGPFANYDGWKATDWPKSYRPYPAVTINLERHPNKPAKPCVFINTKGMLARKPAIDYGEGLLRARATIIIHELGHCARVIPSDFAKNPEEGKAQSQENNACVERNCFRDPCESYTPCIVVPSPSIVVPPSKKSQPKHPSTPKISKVIAVPGLGQRHHAFHWRWLAGQPRVNLPALYSNRLDH